MNPVQTNAHTHEVFQAKGTNKNTKPTMTKLSKKNLFVGIFNLIFNLLKKWNWRIKSKVSNTAGIIVAKESVPMVNVAKSVLGRFE